MTWLDRKRKQSMARARAEGGNSVFDVRDLEDLQDIEEDCEGEVGEREVVLLAIRSITVVLVVLGSVLLTFKVCLSLIIAIFIPLCPSHLSL